MKFAFMFVSLICGILLALLSYILMTGKIPFRPAPAPASLFAAATNAAVGKNLDVLPGEKVAELIESLKKEREAYEKKRVQIEEEYAKGQVEDAALNGLKAELKQVQEALEKELRAIDESEKKNLQTVADVYAKMEPAQAAGVLKKMDERRAALVLSLMSDRQAAAILDEVTLSGETGNDLAVKWAEVIRKQKTQATTPKATPP